MRSVYCVLHFYKASAALHIPATLFGIWQTFTAGAEGLMFALCLKCTCYVLVLWYHRFIAPERLNYYYNLHFSLLRLASFAFSADLFLYIICSVSILHVHGY